LPSNNNYVVYVLRCDIADLLLVQVLYDILVYLSCWQEIDEYIAKAKEQGYHTVLHLGTKGVNYATTVLMQTAIKVSY
jgi:hypothetical protein